MSLIDTTYFVRDCNLPAGALNTIASSITRYERDILIHILGYDLYKLVAAYDVSSSPQRVRDIVEGKEYIEGNYSVKWNGLVNSDKVSILAYYVYIQYLRDKSLTFQNVGTVGATTENSVVVSPAPLIQRASARMIGLIGCPVDDIYAPTLYNFMSNAGSAVYPEWIYNEIRLENSFGL